MLLEPEMSAFWNRNSFISLKIIWSTRQLFLFYSLKISKNKFHAQTSIKEPFKNLFSILCIRTIEPNMLCRFAQRVLEKTWKILANFPDNQSCKFICNQGMYSRTCLRQRLYSVLSYSGHIWEFFGMVAHEWWSSMQSLTKIPWK